MTNRILELGCGEGLHANFISAKSNQNTVIGIDISQKDILTAKKRYPKLTFKIMSAEKLDFKDNFFDQIYAYEVFEHIDNLQKAVKECNRVLKRGGKLILSVPAEKPEEWLLKLRPPILKKSIMSESLGKII